VTTKDPHAMVRRIRSSVVTLSRSGPAATPCAVCDLVQAVKDLDNHLSWGGTPPDEWRSAPFALPPARVSDTGAHHASVMSERESDSTHEQRHDSHAGVKRG